MSADKDITKSKGFKWLLIFLLIGIILLGLLFYKINVWAVSPFSDTFEAYNLGDLAGQGNWTHLDSSGTYNVIDSISHSGSKSVQGVGGRIDKLGDYVSVGEWTFWYYKTGTGLVAEILLLGDWENWDIGCGEIWADGGSGDVKIYDMAGGFPQITFDSTPYTQWFQITIQWDFGSMLYRARVNENEWSNWYHIYNACSGLGFRGVRLRTSGSGGEYYIDDIGEEAPPPPERIWGIDPESGTEITTMDATLTIGYEGFDWNEYDGFVINFKDERLNTPAKSKLYNENDLDPSGAGEIEINLSDFEIDKNGNWYLTGLGFGTTLDVEGGMFLTTRGYIDFWSDELVDPEYYLDFNVEGLSEFYPVSGFDTWYNENVPEFATPTAMATNITSFFQPILQTIGEFNDRVQNYFDNNEAYDKGFALGEVFPIITGYISAISFFMGSFPLVSWFKYIIILLFGIFLIRAILKFIPFLGK